MALGDSSYFDRSRRTVEDTIFPLFVMNIFLVFVEMRPWKKYIDYLILRLMIFLWLIKILIYFFRKKRTKEWSDKLRSITNYAPSFLRNEIIVDFIIAPFYVFIYFTGRFELYHTIYGVFNLSTTLFNYHYAFVSVCSMFDSWLHQTISLILLQKEKYYALKKYNQVDPQNICIICHDHMDMFGRNDVVLIGCGHVFHKECIDQYAEYQRNMIAVGRRCTHPSKCCLCKYLHQFKYVWPLNEAIKDDNKSIYQLIRDIRYMA